MGHLIFLAILIAFPPASDAEEGSSRLTWMKNKIYCSLGNRCESDSNSKVEETESGVGRDFDKKLLSAEIEVLKLCLRETENKVSKEESLRLSAELNQKSTANRLQEVLEQAEKAKVSAIERVNAVMEALAKVEVALEEQVRQNSQIEEEKRAAVDEALEFRRKLTRKLEPTVLAAYKLDNEVSAMEEEMSRWVYVATAAVGIILIKIAMQTSLDRQKTASKNLWSLWKTQKFGNVFDALQAEQQKCKILLEQNECLRCRESLSSLQTKFSELKIKYLTEMGAKSSLKEDITMVVKENSTNLLEIRMLQQHAEHIRDVSFVTSTMPRSPQFGCGISFSPSRNNSHSSPRRVNVQDSSENVFNESVTA